jgi:hypothetical protein
MFTRNKSTRIPLTALSSALIAIISLGGQNYLTLPSQDGKLTAGLQERHPPADYKAFQSGSSGRM